MSIVLYMSHLGAHTSSSPILLPLFITCFETHLLEPSSEYNHEPHKKISPGTSLAFQ